MSGMFTDIANFLVGNGDKGKTNTNTTTQGTSNTNMNQSTESNPWSGVMPQLQQYLQGLGGVMTGTPQISNYEQSGYDALQGAAGQSGSNLNPAISANNDTISGKYLTPDSNPYLKAMGDQVAGQAAQTVNGTFGGAGRTGSGLNQYYAGKGAADALTNLYGNEYNQERGLQQQAIGQAPGLNAATLQSPEALISAGTSISSRPYDIQGQLGGILSQIAGLGGTSNTSGTSGTTATTTSQGQTTTQKPSVGVAGDFARKLFS